MADTFTPRLGLRQMADGEQSGYVTYNDMLRMLDGIVNAVVQSATVTDPPGSPQEGQCWYVPVGATGAWVGNEGKLAQWYNAQWWYYDTAGMLIYVLDQGEYLQPAAPDASAYMALTGAAATGLSITTTPTGLDVADAFVVSAGAPNPSTVDLANSRITVNDHTADATYFVNMQASIDGPSSAETYFAGIYKNAVLESSLRVAYSTTNQFGSGSIALPNGLISVQSGDVIECRFWTTGSTRAVTFQSFLFSLVQG